MITLFYPASFLPHKNHSLLANPLITEFLLQYDIMIYLTISESDCSFISPNIISLGRISHQECMQYLEQSSALLFLSSFESLGLPLIEAAQMQKPVICPDLAYARELLGDSAYYFSLQSPESLCQTLSSFTLLSESPNIAQLNRPMHTLDYAWKIFLESFPFI